MPTRVVRVGNLKVGDRVVEMRERNDAGRTEIEALRVHPVSLRIVEIEHTARGHINLRYEDGSGWAVLLPQVRAEIVMTDADLAELLVEARRLGELKGRAAGTRAFEDDAPLETLLQFVHWIDDGTLIARLEPVTPFSESDDDAPTVQKLLSHVGLGAPLAATPDETAAFINAADEITAAFVESYRTAYEAQVMDDVEAFLTEAYGPDYRSALLALERGGSAPEESHEPAPLARSAHELEAQVSSDPGKLTVSRELTELLKHLQETANDHDEDGVCRHCQVPPDHPVFHGWKRSFSPGEVERLIGDRQKPHRIVDGVCRDCAHDAGKSWAKRMKELDDPTRLDREHARGDHKVPRARCPKCEADNEARETARQARQAEWQAIHAGEGHVCPDCEDERLLQLDWEHQRGKHIVHVPGCEQCQSAMERARALAAHRRGEHESFDYKDKNAVAPCSECRLKQAPMSPGGSPAATTGDPSTRAPTSRGRFAGWGWRTPRPSWESRPATGAPSGSSERSRSSASGPGPGRASRSSPPASPRSSSSTTPSG